MHQDCPEHFLFCYLPGCHYFCPQRNHGGSHFGREHSRGSCYRLWLSLLLLLLRVLLRVVMVPLQQLVQL
jgi:hypothetical protein